MEELLEKSKMAGQKTLVVKKMVYQQSEHVLIATVNRYRGGRLEIVMLAVWRWRTYPIAT